MSYSIEKNALQDKVILITGAGAGIGQAAAYAFAEHGATVILLGKNPNQLSAVYDHIIAQHWPMPAIYPMNLAGANNDHYVELAINIEKEFGRLDGVLHNAALIETLTPLEHYPLERWYKVMQTNVNAPFLLTKALLPLLKKAPRASVVFTIDKATTAYRGAYGVSKMALQGLMQILADELEVNTNVRVNSIYPGTTRTALRARICPGEDPMKNTAPAALMNTYLYLFSDAVTEHGKTFELQQGETL